MMHRMIASRLLLASGLAFGWHTASATVSNSSPGQFISAAVSQASSLSGLSDRREPSGEARSDSFVFEAHSGSMQRKNGRIWTASPTGAADQPQVRQAASVTDASTDPLASPRWQDMRRMFFGDQAVVFDERVRVSGPQIAEDSMNVPVSVDVSALQDVQEVIVFVDFNPIIKVLSFEPLRTRASLGFRLKLQQSSPVRAAARLADGTWHVGGAWVNATGGGCTLPSVASGSPEWQDKLNEVSGRIWPRVDGGERARLRIIHPMDTGLAGGIPAFFIEELELSDSAQQVLMRIQSFEPVSENPVFSIDLTPEHPSGGRLLARGRDNNGNPIDAWVTP